MHDSGRVEKLTGKWAGRLIPFALVLLAGCKDGTSQNGMEGTGSSVGSRETAPTTIVGSLRSFPARGVIRELRKDGKAALIHHEEIVGFMPEMTMKFTVHNADELRNLQSGDAVSFVLKVTDAESWIEEVQREATPFSLPPSVEFSTGSLRDIPGLKPGDELADAEFLSEEGKAVRFSDFEGQAFAFTFIFTRCPLPDYCPRMNQQFHRTREILLTMSGATRDQQLLSISFDPKFDTPEVLKSYAGSVRGPDSGSWLFASASAEVMESLASQLDFRFAEEDGSFVHNLRTVVVDPQRRMYRQFDGNEWEPSELAQALIKAADSAGR